MLQIIYLKVQIPCAFLFFFQLPFCVEKSNRWDRVDNGFVPSMFLKDIKYSMFVLVIGVKRVGRKENN